MADKKNARALNEEDLGTVAGGFAGHDKYTHEEYSKAGVSWDHNTWSRDQYYYNGKKISQKEAETITAAYFLTHDNKK